MRVYLFCSALLLCFSAASQATVSERTLANGLKVIVKEDNRAPVVVQQIWYKAGSMDERTGVTGVAHVLEHLMFKGTSNLADNDGRPQSVVILYEYADNLSDP